MATIPPNDAHPIRLFFRNATQHHDAQRLVWKATAPRFNAFKALKIQYDELRHSRFLAFLLDPQERHDQGTAFLRSFLGLVGLSDIEDLGTTSVTTEYPLPGHERRLDLLIENPRRLAVVLENKVMARESPRQVADYQDWLSRREPPDMKRLLVFLTPTGISPTNPLSNPPVRILSYSELGRWLRGFSHLPGALGLTLNMYADICSEIGEDQMASTNEEDFSAIVTTKSELEIALKISRWAIKQRTDVFTSFWLGVKEQLEARLRSHSREVPWQILMKKDLVRASGTALYIVPSSAVSDPATVVGWKPACFTVMAAYLHGGGADPCYYGIRGRKETNFSAQESSGYGALVKKFRSRGFKSNNWWVAYRDATQDGFPVFDVNNDDSTVALFDDNRSANRPIATLVADTIWTLFADSRLELEQLNAEPL